MHATGHWLRGAYNPKEKNSKPRTWHTLIEVLQDKIVSEEAMANKVEKEKYPDTNQGRYIIIIICFVIERDHFMYARCGNHFKLSL